MSRLSCKFQIGTCSSYMEEGFKWGTTVPVSDCVYFLKFRVGHLNKVRVGDMLRAPAGAGKYFHYKPLMMEIILHDVSQ